MAVVARLVEQFSTSAARRQHCAFGGRCYDLAYLGLAVLDHFRHGAVLGTESNAAVNRNIDPGVKIYPVGYECCSDITHEFPIVPGLRNLSGFYGGRNGVFQQINLIHIHFSFSSTELAVRSRL